jgi:hypothetical protein
LDAPYSLTTHIFPATHLRTSSNVPVPLPPPENATKAERLECFKKTTEKLRDLRVTMDPQGVPQVLWNCANRYARTDLDGKRTNGVTLFFAHANGFPKEVMRTDSIPYFMACESHFSRYGSRHYGISFQVLPAL